MVWNEFALLLWLVFCSEIILALEELYGDLWFSLRERIKIWSHVG